MKEILFNNYVKWQSGNCIKVLESEYSHIFSLLDFSIIEETLQQKILSISLSALIQDIHKCKEEKKLGEEDLKDTKIEYQNYDNLFLTNVYKSEFSSKYPLLMEKVSILKSNFFEYTKSILKAVLRDENQLVEEFKNSGFKAEKLVEIIFDGGDTHNNGKSVAILEFESGKLVFKPHSLSNEIFFNNLLQKLNSKNNFNLKVIKNIDHSQYGYQEFIKEVIPSDRKVIESYYKNLGALTSISYFLTLTDIHYDNILMSSESPIFYDIETLFSAKIKNDKEKKPGMVNSVLNTSILPTNPTEVFQKVDVSGMFGNFHYKDEYFENKFLVNEFTSDIKIVQNQVPVLKKSILKENLEAVNPIYFLDNFLEGFSKYSVFLYENKSLLIEFIEDNISEKNINRTILRDTQLYIEFLNALYNANYLQNKNQEKAILNLLYKNKSLDLKIIDSEIKQLKRGDIPYFYYSVTNKNLNDSQGVVCENYMKDEVYNNVLDFIKGIELIDIDFQINLIEKSFALIRENIFSSELQKIGEIGVVSKSYSQADILKVCRRYLDNLLEKNLFYVDDYINLACVKLLPWTVVGGIDYDLYENFGILVVLAQVDRYSSFKAYYHIVESLFDTAIERFKLDLSKKRITISAFSGIGSIIYVSAMLYKIYGNQKYYDILQENLQQSLSIIEKTRNIDYIDGLSGFIVLISNLYESISLPITALVLEKSTRQLKILLTEERLNLDGIGLAHGVLGLVYALLRLNDIYNSSYYDQKIVELLENIDQIQVSDLCETTTWCRGIMGILPILDRLSSEGLLKFSIGELDFDVTISNGNSLCHGISGNLLSLLFLKNDDLLSDFIPIVQKKLFEDVRSGNFNLNQKVTLYHNSISGLMLGEAGVVYGLLSTVMPDITNILYLDI